MVCYLLDTAFFAFRRERAGRRSECREEIVMLPRQDPFEEQFTLLSQMADRVGVSVNTAMGIEYISDHQSLAQWTTSVQSLLRRVFGPTSEYYNRFVGAVRPTKPDVYPREFSNLKGVFLAAKTDYEAGYTLKLQSLVAADVFADFLEMAEYLLQESYKDPAAVLVGGVLEEHLRRLCQHNGISITRPTAQGRTVPLKADAMNAELARWKVYSKLDQKSVTAWLDLRNNAAHGEYDAYNQEQVRNMLEGIREFAKRTLA